MPRVRIRASIEAVFDAASYDEAVAQLRAGLPSSSVLCRVERVGGRGEAILDSLLGIVCRCGDCGACWERKPEATSGCPRCGSLHVREQER
jgi:hypothetical protein